MELINQTGPFQVLRFNRGEEMISRLVEYCEKNNIKAGWLSMLGASGEMVLSYYNMETKQYEDHEFTKDMGDMEVAGITGNIGTFEGKIMVHAHGSFGDKDLATKSAHIKSLKVAATLEVLLIILQGEIVRKFDEETGLKLMSVN